MDTSISSAAQQICDEKGISLESVIETIEAAIAAAYRKDYGSKNQNIKVKFKLETGDFEVYDEKTVVDKPVLEEDEEKENNDKKKAEDKKMADKGKTQEELEAERALRFNPKTEMQIAEAKEIKKDAELGDVLRIDLEVHKDFGRMASQTAKQVIIQKLREAERNALYDDFKGKEKEVMIGAVQRSLGKDWLVDLGKVTGLLARDESLHSEDYKPGAKMKFFILSVAQTSKGPEILVSRANPEILKRLFVLEIPEISSGTVEIKSLAREAGSRSKVAVAANEDGIDPIGACVGQRGARIQTIINEVGGEKIDIILYDKDIKKFIANSLSPAKITTVDVDEKAHFAKVLVNPDQLSLAIGKAGQNVRLAAKLTGWKINIKSVDGQEFKMEETGDNKKAEGGKDEKRKSGKLEEGVSKKIKEEETVKDDSPKEEVKKEKKKGKTKEKKAKKK